MRAALNDGLACNAYDVAVVDQQVQINGQLLVGRQRGGKKVGEGLDPGPGVTLPRRHREAERRTQVVLCETSHRGG